MSFYKNKNILVTGGSGFIGSNFLVKLSKLDAKITATIHKNTLQFNATGIKVLKTDLNSLDEAIKATKNIDYVFHCAGGISSAGTTVSNPMSVLSTNIILTMRLLEASWINGVKRFLIFSSGTTGYPPYEHSVIENDFWIDDPAPVYFGYGWSRRFNEIISKFVHDKSDMKISICRPSAPYGKYDNFDINTGHVVPALIARAVKKENPFVVWGNGDELRDFIYASDFVEGCLSLLEKKSDCDPVNISFGKSSTIKTLVNYILKSTNHLNADLIFDESKPTTIPVRKINNSKAIGELDFSPSISLEEGINKTVGWYKALDLEL